MKTPLHYQATEYDCGPTSLLNGMMYLFEREQIPPEIVRNIMLYCMDCFGADGMSGKNGTSTTAMMFLSNWLNGYGEAAHLPVSSYYLHGKSVHLGRDSLIRDGIRRGGVAVLRVDLEGLHYLLLTGIEDDVVYLFDPYYEEDQPEDADGRIVMVRDHPFSYNRIVPVDLLERTVMERYAMGPAEIRECVMLFNTRTELTEEKTVEYFI